MAGISGKSSLGATVVGGIVGGIIGAGVGAVVGFAAPHASPAAAVGAVSGLMGGVLGGAAARGTTAAADAIANNATPTEVVAKGIEAAADPSSMTVDAVVGITTGTLGGLGHTAAAGTGKIGQAVAAGIVESTTGRAGGLLGGVASEVLGADHNSSDTNTSGQADEDNSETEEGEGSNP